MAVGTFKKNCFVHCVGLSSTETDPETDHELLLFLVHTQLVGQKAQHWSEQTCRQDIFFFFNVGQKAQIHYYYFTRCNGVTKEHQQ